MTKHALYILGVAAVLMPLAAFGAEPQFLEDDGEGDFNLTGTLNVKSAAALDARIVFNYQANKKHYLLTVKQGRATLQRVGAGAPLALGVPAALPLKDGMSLPFTLQRRGWRISLVCSGRVVLRAFDTAFQDGRVGTTVSNGAFADLRLQPVGEIFADDDFVREEGAESIWQPILGKWEARTLRDDPQATREEMDKSANAFSYFGSGSPRAITVGGHWFWDRYSLESSIKPMGKGAVGIVLYYQDDRNYLLARWTSFADAGPNGNKLQLVARQGDAEKVLAEREGGYEPGQWTKLRAQVCDGIVQCLVDDEWKLEAQTDLFGQGQIGLYVEGQSGAFFDDVVCNEWELVREQFSETVPLKWRGQGWVQKDGVMTYAGTGRSLCATGLNWDRYMTTADVTVDAKGGGGLAICLTDPKTYCALRIAPQSSPLPYRGKAQLVRFTETGGTVLAEQPFTGQAGRHNVRVSIEDGLLTGAVDDGPRLQGLVAEVYGGAIALYSDGRASFDNVRLSLLPVRKGSHITKEFTESEEHPEMSAWASTKAPWVVPAEGSDEWWSKGDYFGNTSVTFTVPAVGSKTGTARAVLGAEPGQKSGVALDVTATQKSNKLQLSLTAGKQKVGEAEVDVEGDANIVFSRESSLYVVRVNDVAVVSVTR